MFELLPVELVEKILLYLNIEDIFAFLIAFDRQHCNLSDYFWKRICLQEDFIPTRADKDWYECFLYGVNRKFGFYQKLEDPPSGVLKHVHFRSLIMEERSSHCPLSTYNVYFLDSNNNFNLVQKITEKNLTFKDEFVIIKNGFESSIYMYCFESNTFKFWKSVLENKDDIFGISLSYCLSYISDNKCVHLINFDHDVIEEIKFPSDVKFITEIILHRPSDNIVVSTLSFVEGYKIKVFEIKSRTWILDLMCFGSTGITNDPNVWVGSNFIGCCDVSYRLRGVYFGPFKVWNKKGALILRTDIEASTKHYLRCFFKQEYVILTTSDTKINVFNKDGECVSLIETSGTHLDIKVSSGHLLFVLLEDSESVQIYDWKKCCQLYKIQLKNQCCKSLSSEYMYCAIHSQCDKGDTRYEVVSYIYKM